MQAEQQEFMAKNEENVMLIQKLEDTITKSQLEITALNNKVISGQNGLLREVFFFRSTQRKFSELSSA